MKLSHEIAKILEEDLEKIIQREINEPDFMPMENYLTCEDRFRDMVHKALEMGAVKTGALSVLTHRESEDHNDDRQYEFALLTSVLPPERIEIGKRSFWNN